MANLSSNSHPTAATDQSYVITMSRWHQSSCLTPIIAIQSSATPHCLSCRSSPPKTSVLMRGHPNTFLQALPNELMGNLNLRWPPTMRYLNSKNTPPANWSAPSEPGDHTSNNAAGTGGPHCSTIYTRRLRENEFRLIHVSPSPFSNAPLHLAMATYLDDDYPDYEAVSYTWGGDKGDSTPCIPVFIGPFWDILLQTRNCAAMLRYVRHPDSQRPLWVDAICINQIDLQEKAIQIPKMTSIYKQCFRVLAFLGESATQGPQQQGRRMFPKRRPISDLTADVRSQRQMLESNYFTRLWVIQELVLARHVVFVHQGVEYHAEATSAAQVPFDTSAAPWLAWLGRQSIASENDLLGAMALTGHANCADIRDKLFGILGLVHGNQAQLMKPDYTLSSLQVFVGFFSHCVVVLGHIQRVLFNAIGLRGWGKQPSWVPSWSSDDGITLADFSRQNYGQQLSDMLGTDFTSRPNPFRHLYDGVTDRNHYQARRIVLHHESDDDVPPWSLFPLPQQCWVDSKNGALSLRLVHFCGFFNRLESLGLHFNSDGQQRLFAFRAWARKIRLDDSSDKHHGQSRHDRRLQYRPRVLRRA